MKKLISQWKDSWRTSFYYIGFSILLSIFYAPIHLGKLNIIESSNTVKIIFYVCMTLFYFPFTVRWASKISGLHPLTRKEAVEKDKKKKKYTNLSIRK